MTAVVGILNKHAIAIAADSAVTLGGVNGNKILNNVDKIFTLSKHHPVGIMIYNSSQLMYTPWEIIIKVYRKQLKDNSFPKLSDYQEDFITFLKSKNYFTDESEQKIMLNNYMLEVIGSCVSSININHNLSIESLDPTQLSIFMSHLEKEIEEITKSIQSHEKLPEFTTYEFETFKAYSQDVFDNISGIYQSNGITLSPDFLEKFKRCAYTIMVSIEDQSLYTGLIFVGFGEDEIYPQLIPLQVSQVVDNKLRYFVVKNGIASITNQSNAAIRPFGQPDVINTILTGIAPDLDNAYYENFKVSLYQYHQSLLNATVTNPALQAEISKIDVSAMVNALFDANKEVKNKTYISPLMEAVGTLGKEDLTEMAESLIYLTYLKRRITFAQESVGGPVDVAVITKGDGFIWIKRKHYFKPELNQHFFNNYFSK